MTKLLVVFFVILVSASISFAECKEYKIIEHGNSTEVICIGDNPSKNEGGAGQRVADNPTVYDDNRQKVEQERKGMERCDLDFTSCTSSCRGGDNRCVNS